MKLSLSHWYPWSGVVLDLCPLSYLDVIFENTMKFDSHISHVVNSTQLLGLIKRTFKALNEQCFLALYQITKKDLKN